MTTSLARIFAAALMVAVLAALSACGLEKPYPAKSFFTIEVPPSGRAPSAPSGGALRVNEVRVAAPFDERPFQYRKASSEYESDYYVNFITDPESIITGSLIEWLSSNGGFTAVVDASSPVSADRALEGRITELYGDYREAGNPKAVVRARFFLLDESGADARVVFSREYAEAEPMNGREPAALVEAWGAALAEIYDDLARDLVER